MRVAFDVDGCLIHDDYPNRDVINVLLWFYDQDQDVTVWSGMGKEYADMWGRRLFLPEDITYRAKPFDSEPLEMDISFDDQIVKLATVNVRVS